MSLRRALACVGVMTLGLFFFVAIASAQTWNRGSAWNMNYSPGVRAGYGFGNSGYYNYPQVFNYGTTYANPYGMNYGYYNYPYGSSYGYSAYPYGAFNYPYGTNFGEVNSSYYWNRYSSGSPVYSAGYYSSPTVDTPTSGSSIGSQAEYSYGMASPAEVFNPNAVKIHMNVPADAEVWFDGTKTSQTGTSRDYVSPAVRPGRDFHYEVRVRWPEKGTMIEKTKRIEVHAGDFVNLDFSGNGSRNGQPVYGAETGSTSGTRSGSRTGTSVEFGQPGPRYDAVPGAIGGTATQTTTGATSTQGVGTTGGVGFVPVIGGAVVGPNSTTNPQTGQPGSVTQPGAPGTATGAAGAQPGTGSTLAPGSIPTGTPGTTGTSTTPGATTTTGQSITGTGGTGTNTGTGTSTSTVPGGAGGQPGTGSTSPTGAGTTAPSGGTRPR